MPPAFMEKWTVLGGGKTKASLKSLGEEIGIAFS